MRYKVLMRVLTINREGTWLIIPAWNHRASICVNNIDRQLQPGDRFCGKVFLSVNDPLDLCPGDYEFEPIN